MDRKELAKRWERYCLEYVPQQPGGFSAEDYVLDAETSSVPSAFSRQMAAGDRLVNVSFHKAAPEYGLGTLERSRETISELTEFLRRGNVRMAFEYELGRDEDVHIVRDTSAVADRDIWFIGDLHGDILALRTLLAFAASNSERRPLYVFLGDLFDRNPFGLNVLIEVVRILKEDPSSIFLLAGNHDAGLVTCEKGFSSRITPHQFSDELNAFGDEVVSAFAREFVRLAGRLPVGLVLPNGLLATHGGVPSRPERNVKNIWDGLRPREIVRLIHDCRSEFLNNRFQKENATKLSPDFGWMELVNFSEAIEKAYGVPVRSMVRGHDHCDLCRHDWARSSFGGNDYCPPERAARVRDVLTMTSMVMMYGEKNLPGFLQHETSFPTVARYNPADCRPTAYTVCFDSAAVKSYLSAAEKPINVEHARFFVERKPTLEAERERLRTEQLNLERELKNETAKYGQFQNGVGNAQNVVDAWSRKVVELEKRKVPDSPQIVSLLERIEDRQKILDGRKRNLDDRARREKRGEIRLTRLDDLGDALKETGKWIAGTTDENYREEIAQLEAKVVALRREAQESNPDLDKARKSLADAERALDVNRRGLSASGTEVDNLKQRQKELIMHLNDLQTELDRCRDAESLLAKEAK